MKISCGSCSVNFMVKTGEHVKNKLENILPLGWEVNTVVKKQKNHVRSILGNYVENERQILPRLTPWGRFTKGK